jgi:hypothetical protein
MEKNWIPKPEELVRWQGKLYTVISVDFGGKVKIKKFTTTRRISEKYIVDVSELTPVI